MKKDEFDLAVSLHSKGLITKDGLKSLEKYKVQRAIFIAAGEGLRLRPITINTPKPLVRVNGVRLIDTLLDAVIDAGIEEIIIVRGYLGEQFDQLLYKYPNIKFIDNPFFHNCNNISSVYMAREYLKSAYVIEADLLLRNMHLITKYQYMTNYLGVSVNKTDDWCFEVTNSIITKIMIGGENCYHMFGISYWNEEDGKKLAKHVLNVFENLKIKNCYWDEVALDYFLKEYKIEVRLCSFDDIAEIDTYEELKSVDKMYVI